MPLIRIVLDDGDSIIASWDHASIARRGFREDPMVMLTAEESVERLPVARVEAILGIDAGIPLPGDAPIFRFATLS